MMIRMLGSVRKGGASEAIAPTERISKPVEDDSSCGAVEKVDM